jgi:hypothetical protein
VVGIAAIVGFAVAGSASAEGDTARAGHSPSPAASAQTVAVERSLWVDVPGHRDEVITTPDVTVRGRVAASVEAVWIVLESSSGKPVAAKTIDVSRKGHVRFEGRFDLSMPRPAGALTVLVVAVGPDGVPIDAIRRRFQLGGILEVSSPPGR